MGGVGLQSADWIKCIGESQGPCLAISERNVSAPHQRQNLGGFDRKDGKEVTVTCDQNREITNQRVYCVHCSFAHCHCPFLFCGQIRGEGTIDGTSRDDSHGFPSHDLTSLSCMQDCYMLYSNLVFNNQPLWEKSRRTRNMKVQL